MFPAEATAACENWTVNDSFETLASETRASIRVKRSEFIGIAFPVTSEVEFRGRLDDLRKEMHSARHHCWAFEVSEGGVELARSSDDGEPAGSAGRPIASAIGGSGLRNVGCVVARWFGGVKLGTGGLGRAYREAAAEALDLGPRTTVIAYSRIRVDAPFEELDQLYRLVDPPDVVLVHEQFGPEGNRFDLDIRKSRVEQMTRKLDERMLRWTKIG